MTSMADFKEKVVKVNGREVCPHDEFCGGCIYQEIPYEEQLKIKEKEVLTLLENKGIAPEALDKIEGCPSLYGYRNKMEYTFGDFVKDGDMTLGMHRKKSFMSIVTVNQCQLVVDDFNKILTATLEFCGSKGYKAHNKKSHRGLMRNLIIRRGVYTKQIIVNIVTTSDDTEEGVFFDEAGFAEMICSLDLENTVVGVLRTINDSLADAVIPQEIRTIYGVDYYMEEILGLKFKVSAFSFFQTNVEAVERLYREAIDLIEDFSGKTVFDLYCGTGTISQIMALKAKKVIGVELVEEAVEAAKENARENGLENCHFIAGDVFEVLDKVAEKPDVIVVDPPRVGIQPKALDKIIAYGVKEILYISCNPKTLAENLKYFDYYGYKCKYLKPFDNFPMTKHVETIVLLSKLDSKKYISVELPMDDMDLTNAESKATYKQIQNYVLEKFGFKVSTLYIAQVKKKHGLEVREHYNMSKNEKQKIPKCPIEKEEVILDALKHFKMIKDDF